MYLEYLLTIERTETSDFLPIYNFYLYIHSSQLIISLNIPISSENLRNIGKLGRLCVEIFIQSSKSLGPTPLESLAGNGLARSKKNRALKARPSPLKNLDQNGPAQSTFPILRFTTLLSMPYAWNFWVQNLNIRYRKVTSKSFFSIVKEVYLVDDFVE